LLGCVSFAGDPFRYARFLGLVSFDYHPGVVFLSHIRDVRCYCSSLSSPSDTNRSLPLSPQKATPVPITTLALSSQKVTRSISLLRSPHRPTPFVVASCARSEDRALSPQKAGAAAGRPVAYTRRRKGLADVDHGVIQRRRLLVPSPWVLVPSSALSPRPQRRLQSSSSVARSPCRKSSSRWKLSASFLFIEILQLS
jgi:hypothetical protein